jgi:hypothetical protein
MNMHAGSLATNHLNNCADPSKVAPFILASQARLTVKGEKIKKQFVE